MCPSIMDPRKYNSEINRLDKERGKFLKFPSSRLRKTVKENERKVSLIIRIELFRDLYINIFLNKMLLVFSQRGENSWIEMKSNMRYTKRKFPKASLLEIITSVLDDDYSLRRIEII